MANMPGKTEVDPEEEKRQQEQLQAMDQAEGERKRKWEKNEHQREGMRAGIRDKVSGTVTILSRYTRARQGPMGRAVSIKHNFSMPSKAPSKKRQKKRRRRHRIELGKLACHPDCRIWPMRRLPMTVSIINDRTRMINCEKASRDRPSASSMTQRKK